MTNVRLLSALVVLILAGISCGGGGDNPSPANSASASASGSRTATATPGASSVTPAAGSPTDTPPPGEEPTIPPAQQTYTVQAGDTLYSIAARFGTTVEAVAQANGISDPTHINVGQVLVIPLVPGQTPVPSTPAPTGAPGTQPPSGGGPAQVIPIGNTSRNAVAFTFDAGSDAGYTTQILDTLQASGIHASFGMTGRFAQQNPQLVQRMVNEGHTLINHTYDHASWTGNSTGAAPLTRDQRWAELDQTESIIAHLTGATTLPYFRPPYGDYDQSVLDDAGARGYAYSVMWTVDSRGWMGIPAPQITQRCLDNATPGAIYIFHVGSASQDGVALQDIINGLRGQGYTIGDLGSVLAP
jgi:peptidoglycan/xylan/chitin deacetylase (PgdA/CDA1 family)/LysM repeat protein